MQFTLGIVFANFRFPMYSNYMKTAGTHLEIPFKCSSFAMSMTGVSSRDKAYVKYAAKRNWHMARQTMLAAEREY